MSSPPLKEVFEQLRHLLHQIPIGPLKDSLYTALGTDRPFQHFTPAILDWLNGVDFTVIVASAIAIVFLFFVSVLRIQRAVVGILLFLFKLLLVSGVAVLLVAYFWREELGKIVLKSFAAYKN